MKRVVDTSAWIEWLIDGPLAPALADLLPKPDDWVVPTMVQLELAKWLRRERGEEAADEVIAFTLTCQIAPLDSALALMAADLCREHGLATADAVIYATSRQAGAELITCDAHFSGLEGVRHLTKV